MEHPIANKIFNYILRVNRLKYLTILVILIPGILRCVPDQQYQREGERILRSELGYHKAKQPDLQPGPPGIEPGPLGPQVLPSHHLPLCWEDRYTEYKFKKECIVVTEGYFLLSFLLYILFRIFCHCGSVCDHHRYVLLSEEDPVCQS